MTLKSAQLTLLLKGLVQGKFYLNELDVIAVAHLQKKKDLSACLDPVDLCAN